MGQGWAIEHWNKREDKPDRYFCKITDGQGTERIFVNLKKDTLGAFVEIHGKEGGVVEI
jgi:hypothetical protein